MARFRSLLLLLVAALVLLLRSAPTATAEDSFDHFCEGGIYTANSSFHSNLRTLLASLSASNSSFSTDVVGSSDQAFGLVLCRGDRDSNDCESCIKAASKNITQLCVQSKQAIVWYEYCQLRYSDVRFFSSQEYGSKVGELVNGNNQTDPETFTAAAKELMGKVADRAAHNSSSLFFATGMMTYRSDMRAIYGLAQCTRDLSADICSQCLHQILASYWNRYAGRIGGRILGYSCNFRYEVYTFFAGDPTILLDTTISPTPSPSLAPAPILSPPPIASNKSHPPTPTAETEGQSGKGNKKDMDKVLTIAIPSAISLALVIAL